MDIAQRCVGAMKITPHFRATAIAAVVGAAVGPGRTSARLDAWAAGTSRRRAVPLARVLRWRPSTGSAVVPLTQGRLRVAPTSGAVRVRLTDVGYVVAGPP